MQKPIHLLRGATLQKACAALRAPLRKHYDPKTLNKMLNACIDHNNHEAFTLLIQLGASSGYKLLKKILEKELAQFLPAAVFNGMKLPEYYVSLFIHMNAQELLWEKMSRDKESIEIFVNVLAAQFNYLLHYDFVMSLIHETADPLFFRVYTEDDDILEEALKHHIAPRDIFYPEIFMKNTINMIFQQSRNRDVYEDFIAPPLTFVFENYECSSIALFCAYFEYSLEDWKMAIINLYKMEEPFVLKISKLAHLAQSPDALVSFTCSFYIKMRLNTEDEEVIKLITAYNVDTEFQDTRPIENSILLSFLRRGREKNKLLCAKKISSLPADLNLLKEVLGFI